MRFRTALLALALVFTAASPASAFSLDDLDVTKIDFDKLGFSRSFEVMYGEGGTQGLGSYRAGVLSGRQDFLWIFALRLGAMGFLSRATGAATTSMDPGYGIRGDALVTTGPLIPGVQAYAGLGAQVYNQRSNADLQFAARQGYVMGIRALFLQLESRVEFAPGPGAAMLGGMFFEY